MKTHVLTAAALVLALAGCRHADSAPARQESGASTAAAGSAGGTAPAPALDGYSLYDLGSTWHDQRGDSLALGDLAGTVRVVALVYANCRTTCPVLVNELKRIEASLPSGREAEVGFVLVSLDPSRDTPASLARWANETQLDQTRWTLLHGSDASVREIAATLGVRYQVQPGGEVAHANVITVLDAAGRVVHQQTTLGGETIATSAIVNRLLP